LCVGIVVCIGGVVIGFVVVIVVARFVVVQFDGSLGNEGSFDSGAFIEMTSSKVDA